MSALIALLAAVPLAVAQVNIKSVTFNGNYTTNPNDNSVRDLGFSGKIGGTIVNSFGDTFVCQNAYYQTGCIGPYANSAGLGLSPTTFKDAPDSQHPNMFCKYFSDEDAGTWGMGITNVVPTSNTAGVLYFLSIRRNLPYNAPAVGAGVAKITFDGSGQPVCTRLAHNWWDGLTEPWYGDHSAFLSKDGQYIHATGGCNTTNAGGNYLYQSRVPVGRATDLSAYEYWNGNAWTTSRIRATKQTALVDTTNTAITDQGQGQIMYNNHVGKYIYVDRAGLDFDVRIRTAVNPQGPWSAPQKLFAGNIGDCKSFTYSPTLEPWWTGSDQVVDVVFTCAGNILQSARVTFA